MNLTSYISPEGLYAVATGGAALLNGTAEGEQRRDAAEHRQLPLFENESLPVAADRLSF